MRNIAIIMCRFRFFIWMIRVIIVRETIITYGLSRATCRPITGVRTAAIFQRIRATDVSTATVIVAAPPLHAAAAMIRAAATPPLRAAAAMTHAAAAMIHAAATVISAAAAPSTANRRPAPAAEIRRTVNERFPPAAAIAQSPALKAPALKAPAEQPAAKRSVQTGNKIILSGWFLINMYYLCGRNWKRLLI